jgi:alanine racemase
MGALTRDDLEQALAADADIAVWTHEMLEAASAEGGARLHVKFDSGMGRLGTKDPDEARALCERAAADPNVILAGIWTHFATADERGDDHFPHQLRQFAMLANEVKASHPGTIAHAANSAATLRDPAAHFDLVRCGVAIYGLDPFQRDPDDHDLEPALSLHSYVAAVKPFQPGDSAGYGRRWAARSPTQVGVVPIGYGDGWRRGLTNNADVLVKGRRYPLVGTVSMDNVTIDLGPQTEVRPGDEVVLIGRQGGERILAEEVAARLDTINYEVTCGIGRRVRYLHEQ